MKNIKIIALLALLILVALLAFGILVLESFFNTNIQPFSSMDFMLRVTLVVLGIPLLIGIIIAAISYGKQKNFKLSYLLSAGFFIILIVALIKNFSLIQDVGAFLKNETIKYRGYIYATTDTDRMLKLQRTRNGGSYRHYEIKEVPYVKDRRIHLDNYDVVKFRRNNDWGVYVGAAEVEYLPNSHFLLNIKPLDISILKEQAQRLNSLGESVNIPMGTLNISAKYSGDDTYNCKCDIEITRVVKNSQMKEFYNYIQRPLYTLMSNVTPILDEYRVEEFDTSIFEGTYVVIETCEKGGGYAQVHDYYPDGHWVRCKKLKDGKYDPNGIEITFFQSGSFTAVIEPHEIQPIGQLSISA